MGKFIQLNGVNKHGEGDHFICVDADSIQKITFLHNIKISSVTYYDEVEKDLARWPTDDPISSLLKRINEARS